MLAEHRRQKPVLSEDGNCNGNRSAPSASWKRSLSKINQHFTEIARGNLLNFNVDKLGRSSISIPNDATLVLNYGLWH